MKNTTGVWKEYCLLLAHFLTDYGTHDDLSSVLIWKLKNVDASNFFFNCNDGQIESLPGPKGLQNMIVIT